MCFREEEASLNPKEDNIPTSLNNFYCSHSFEVRFYLINSVGKL